VTPALDEYYYSIITHFTALPTASIPLFFSIHFHVFPLQYNPFVTCREKRKKKYAFEEKNAQGTCCRTQAQKVRTKIKRIWGMILDMPHGEECYLMTH
jgi:hypothetical protein